MKILKHCGLELHNVHSLERDILKRFDIAILGQTTYYDIVRNTEELTLGSPEEHLRFFNYMDNYMLYVLINQGFGANVDLHYIAAIMFFCTANYKKEGISRFVALVQRDYTIKSSFVKHLSGAVKELANNLVVLGNNETVVQNIVCSLDIRQLYD